MRPRVKYAVIYRHRKEYSISAMCRFFGVSRSGYYDFVKRLSRPEPDAELAKRIQECQNKTYRIYGYRRVWKWLKDRNIKRNPKTVLRVMKMYGLLSEIRRRRKWVNIGQQAHRYKKPSETAIPCRQSKYKVGHRYFLYSYQRGCTISVHDSGSVRQQFCGLQNSLTADNKSCFGYDPAGNEEGEKESRCRVAAPQRPGLSIYFARIF